MKALTIDTDRRLVLSGATPCECHAVREDTPGRYELAKVIPAPAKPEPKSSPLDALLSSAELNWNHTEYGIAWACWTMIFARLGPLGMSALSHAVL